MIITIFVGIKNETTKLFKMNCRMKTLKKVWLIVFISLVGITNLWAQTDAELKFLAKADSLTTQLLNAYNGKDYPAAEAFCLEIINLYDAHATQLSESYAYYKYANYYNMASMQAKQGKKQEAATSLAKALDSDRMEISYSQVINDEDLKGILDAEVLQPVLKRLKKTSDYLFILKNAPEYTRTQQPDSLPQIVYAQADDPNLVRVREYFRLDSVAVAGDEVATIKRILTYIHDKIRHDGQNYNPAGGNNSINYAEASKDGSRGLNCRGLATVLNECYLSMGIPSRVITCMPKTYITDCHVINAVYSSALGKWLWIDPTNNAWVTDDRGNMLSVQEVRERLRSGQPVQVNEEANWNNEKKTTTEDYLYEYMAKNLFYLESWTRYGFNTESDHENLINYIFLQPTGCDSSQRNSRNLSVNDDQYFWQAPR